jgi:hypothetical protein
MRLHLEFDNGFWGNKQRRAEDMCADFGDFWKARREGEDILLNNPGFGHSMSGHRMHFGKEKRCML